MRYEERSRFAAYSIGKHLAFVRAVNIARNEIKYIQVRTRQRVLRLKRAHVWQIHTECVFKWSETLCFVLVRCWRLYYSVRIKIAQVKHWRNGSTVFMVIQRHRKNHRWFVAAPQIQQQQPHEPLRNRHFSWFSWFLFSLSSILIFVLSLCHTLNSFSCAILKYSTWMRLGVLVHWYFYGISKRN